MKILFMGRKPAASLALRELLTRGFEVVSVVAPLEDEASGRDPFWRPLLRDTAREFGIPVVRDQDVYDELLSSSGSNLHLHDLDLVISFLFWKKVKEPLLSAPRIGCFNFHPAPLPEFRGRRGYNFAILEGRDEYGASCHWMDSEFDTGDLVEVRRFCLGKQENALSLERKTMKLMLAMLSSFISLLQSGSSIPRIPQGEGCSATKAEMLTEMQVELDDPPDLTERRVRAFWYPPHHGAYIDIGGRRYTLVDEETLQALGRFIHGSKPDPHPTDRRPV